ncbi:hypothetical protein NPIL_159751 [Nephila pilipes]|uniref:Uncharacterized protein n=1 Tax=Nephila pilipes TaxID=299642 RepID=A0A8X6ULS7_NEPPI|nr:hypothetical protein NPIL_159751 [Nephila pilipes]
MDTEKRATTLDVSIKQQKQAKCHDSNKFCTDLFGLKKITRSDRPKFLKFNPQKKKNFFGSGDSIKQKDSVCFSLFIHNGTRWYSQDNYEVNNIEKNTQGVDLTAFLKTSTPKNADSEDLNLLLKTSNEEPTQDKLKFYKHENVLIFLSENPTAWRKISIPPHSYPKIQLRWYSKGLL